MRASQKQTQKIGLIAGWGRFPIHVATRLTEQGYQVHCLGVHGHADPVLADICHEFHWTGMAKMGSQARFFRKRGIETATLAGKIFKTKIFERFAILKHFPDLTFWRFFYPIFVSRSKDRRDDTLLLTVTQLFESFGVTMMPATDFSPELLVQEGTLSGRVSDSQTKDIQFGWQIAKQMGGLDVGQSIVVKDCAVLAVEAVEGTDECIRRAGTLCKSGGFTVVKVAKPKQDMRFDVPTIGVGTIETIHTAGGKVLAIEANKTIVLDQEDVCSTAKRLGISVIALDHEQMVKNAAA
jgi:DUF1009 family protein